MALAHGDAAALDAVFGPASSGNTPEERAKSSQQKFVRSQIQLALDNPRAIGRRLTAQEALDTFGWHVLSQLAQRQAVPILAAENEPAETLKARRTALGISIPQLSRAASVSDADIVRAEGGTERVPFRILEQLSRHLALDDTLLGFIRGAGGDELLAVRLRELIGNGNAGFDTTSMSPTVVLGLAEAAWVIGKQICLQTKLSNQAPSKWLSMGFRPNPDYRYPAWKVGYALAHETRKNLSMTDDQPIRGLKDKVEREIGIPVVQVDLASKFAGATVASGDARGIAINLNGINSNVWVRRNTLAHELGHLLWDPNEKLNRLLVDEYSSLDVNPRSTNNRDVVEIRANAFAVEFLAPQEAARKVFNGAGSDAEGISRVMTTYGISYSAAKWQIANSLEISPEQFDLPRNFHPPQQDDEWQAGENFTADWFPLNTPICRRGRFSRIAVEAYEKEIISIDTLASFLASSEADVQRGLSDIKSLFD